MMSNGTPLGTNASLIIYRDGEGSGSVAIVNGEDPERDISWQAPDSNYEDFAWLVRSAAAFHGIEVEETLA